MLVVRGSEHPAALAVAPVGALGLGSGLVATAGSWRVTAGEARFTPRFAAVPGTTYAVVERSERRDGSWRELARVVVPGSARTPSTVALSIEPGGDRVPANLLRFSVTFSAPMEEGSAAGRIRLLDEHGEELPGTLLAMPPELWDRERRRLTVLLEPGRIKRGLQPHVQAGPPLAEDASVTLVVDRGIRDADGTALAAGARRTWSVGPPIRSRVDPARWEVRRPASADGSLVVRFDRPLDRRLVLRSLRVEDDRGAPVPGRASVDPDGRAWTFVPAGTGARLLRIDGRLEDVAGNSVRRVFDRDLDLAPDDGVDGSATLPL